MLISETMLSPVQEALEVGLSSLVMFTTDHQLTYTTDPH